MAQKIETKGVPTPTLEGAHPLPAFEPTETQAIAMTRTLAPGNPVEALSLVDKALERFPKSAPLYALGGELHLGKGDTESLEMAEIYFDEARRFDPLNSEAAVGMASIRLAEGKPEKALEQLRPALDPKNSLSPEALRLIETLAKQGIGADELYSLTCSRPAEIDRLTNSEHRDELHRFAKLTLGLDNDEPEGPGRYARTNLEKLENVGATGINIVAKRVAPMKPTGTDTE